MKSGIARTLGMSVATVASVASVCAVSAHASADVSGLQFRLTDQAAEVVVISDHELGEPRVRSERGEVEVWFPKVNDNGRITALGDGKAVLRARLRPGMGASAVLDIDVGGRRQVNLSDVTVEHQDGATIVRIARAALVPVTVAKSKAVAATQPSSATAAQDSPHVAKEIVGTQRAVPNPSSSPALGTKSSKPAATPLIASGGESKMPLLLWLTAGLAAALGAIKLWQRKTTSMLRSPDIEVVATKRLAPGLQLFIVRAFGQEHLLSVNGKTTERIATNEAFDEFDGFGGEASASRPGFKLPNDPGVELIPSRSVLTKAAAPQRSQARPESMNLDPLPLPRSPLTASQSIAGLIRLREELDRVN